MAGARGSAKTGNADPASGIGFFSTIVALQQFKTGQSATILAKTEMEMTQKSRLRQRIEPRFIIGLALFILLTGCVAGDSKVDSDRLATIQQIAVHPVEPPPLVVPSGLQLAMERVGGAGEFGVLGIVVGGIVVAVQADSLGDEAQKFEDYANDLNASQIWQPTEIVAEQVASHLRQSGLYDVEILLPMTELFERDQGYRFDPYGPIRSWYNGNQLSSGALSANSDVVIGAGIWSYELAQDLFALAVVLRAVDPATGDMLGRARALHLPPADDIDWLFANEASEFKALFTRTSDRLTKEALSQLGF